MKFMIIEDSKHNFYIINDEDNSHIYTGTIVIATCEDIISAKMVTSALNNQE